MAKGSLSYLMAATMKGNGKMEILKATVFSNGQMERYTKVYDIQFRILRMRRKERRRIAVIFPHKEVCRIVEER